MNVKGRMKILPLVSLPYLTRGDVGYEMPLLFCEVRRAIRPLCKGGTVLGLIVAFFFIYENRPLQESKCILRKRDFVSIQAFCRVIYIL